MWKRSKKEQKNLEKTAKRFSIITALLSALALTTILLTGVYLYIKNWTPIKGFTAKRANGETEIILEFNTKIPVTGYVLYGTHPTATNKKDIKGTISGESQLQIARVLPNKEHYVNFITQTENGRTFETGFIKVK